MKNTFRYVNEHINHFITFELEDEQVFVDKGCHKKWEGDSLSFLLSHHIKSKTFKPPCENLLYGAAIRMDLVSLHVLSGLLSVSLQMVATVFVLFCVVNFFSIKRGSSMKIVLFSIFYFFFLVFILYVAALLLLDVSRPYHILTGFSALMEACLLHLGYGVIVVALYFRSLVEK